MGAFFMPGRRCCGMRDKLKGKHIMVWTFMGNARMYEALRDYGDCIDTIGLFSFKVDKTGTITESGVAISNMLTYINKWPTSVGCLPLPMTVQTPSSKHCATIRTAHRINSAPNSSASWKSTLGAAV